MNKIEILRREAKKLPGVFPYQSETDGWKGKNYYRFAYDEQVFTVHEDDEFLKAWADNKVHTIKLGISPEGATFLNFATREDLLDEARFTAMLADITERNVKATAVANPESLV
jgi:hypothetical protein